MISSWLRRNIPLNSRLSQACAETLKILRVSPAWPEKPGTTMTAHRAWRGSLPTLNILYIDGFREKLSDYFRETPRNWGAITIGMTVLAVSLKPRFTGLRW
jgi:hypothetical protein